MSKETLCSAQLSLTFYIVALKYFGQSLNIKLRSVQLQIITTVSLCHKFSNISNLELAVKCLYLQ